MKNTWTKTLVQTFSSNLGRVIVKLQMVRRVKSNQTNEFTVPQNLQLSRIRIVVILSAKRQKYKENVYRKVKRVNKLGNVWAIISFNILCKSL